MKNLVSETYLTSEFIISKFSFRVLSSEVTKARSIKINYFICIYLLLLIPLGVFHISNGSNSNYLSFQMLFGLLSIGTYLFVREKMASANECSYMNLISFLIGKIIRLPFIREKLFRYSIIPYIAFYIYSDIYLVYSFPQIFGLCFMFFLLISWLSIGLTSIGIFIDILLRMILWLSLSIATIIKEKRFIDEPSMEEVYQYGGGIAKAVILLLMSNFTFSLAQDIVKSGILT
jgi:hypothetical protein